MKVSAPAGSLQRPEPQPVIEDDGSEVHVKATEADVDGVELPCEGIDDLGVLVGGHGPGTEESGAQI